MPSGIIEIIWLLALLGGFYLLLALFLGWQRGRGAALHDPYDPYDPRAPHDPYNAKSYILRLLGRHHPLGKPLSGRRGRFYSVGADPKTSAHRVLLKQIPNLPDQDPARLSELAKQWLQRADREGRKGEQKGGAGRE